MTDKLTRIAYLEDEPDIRTIAKIALEDIGGFELDISTCGREAIRRMPDFRPDLILMDVMMPDMNGIQTLRELKKNSVLATTPIVFMTAKVQQQELENYKKIGAIGVIAKPFDPLTLADQVRAILVRQGAKGTGDGR